MFSRSLQVTHVDGLTSDYLFAIAKELVYTAARVDADWALDIGLVNIIAPADALLEEARAMAAEIAKSAPIALAQAKVAMSRGYEADLETGLEIEAQCYAATLTTEDRLEGLAAFAEKRPPQWKGR